MDNFQRLQIELQCFVIYGIKGLNDWVVKCAVTDVGGRLL